MKKITLEKVLWFVGRLIRAVFLIAWNLTKMAFALFLVFLGMAVNAGPSGASLQADHLREVSRRQYYWPYCDD